MTNGSTFGLRLALVALTILAGSGAEAFPQASRVALGSAPETPWTCPVSHPIKGNFTTYSDEPCIYHVPGWPVLREDQAGAVLCDLG